LKLLDTGLLFPLNTTQIAVRRGHYLRSYGYRFIEQCAPELDEMTVRRALNPEREAALA
jgi:LysR family cys regulon transcriptional activator